MRNPRPVVRSRQFLGVIVGGLATIAGCTGMVSPTANQSDDDGSGGTSSGPRGGTGSGGRGTGSGSGSGSGGGDVVAPPAPGEFGYQCDAEAVPASTPMRRLTVAQYRNTLRDLLRFGLKDDAQATMVLSAAPVVAGLATMGKDEAEQSAKDKFGSYRRLDQSLQQDHVDGSYAVAIAVAAELTNPARLAKLVGTCATDADAGNDAQCLNTFITKFGERAFRRPLVAEDVTLMKTFYGSGTASDPLAYADLITGFLTVPWFVYHVEHGGNDVVGGKAGYYKLTDFELASRLSYQFTETMPDDALFEAARSGSLTKDAKVYATQVDRLMATDVTKQTVDQFLFDQFKLFPSEIRNLETLDTRNADAGFKKFAGTNLPSRTLGKAMQDEILAMGRHFTWTQPGTFRDLLKTDLSFATTADLASIYGVPAWSGSGDPPKLPAGQRSGLLGRAAFLSTGMITTRPIIKGVFTREHILCDTIPPPPPGVGNTAIDRMNKTTREGVEGITEQAGTACIGCHRSKINPLGFVTENFDALGRLRTEERLFNDSGAEYGKKPVDTRAVPQVTAGDMTEVSSLGGLVDLIDKSGKAEGCFARGYFRFTFQRWDDIDQDDLERKSADACVVERLRQKTRSGTLRDVFKEVALTTAFQSRNFN